MKYITFKTNKGVRKIRFSCLEKDINNLSKCDKIITKYQDIKIIVSLPNSMFLKEFHCENGFTYKQLFYNIYETICRAINTDREKYPMSYPKNSSIQQIVNSYCLRCTRETSDIQVDRENVHVTFDL